MPRSWAILGGLSAALALVLLGRLTVFMADSGKPAYSFVPTSDWEVRHSCVSAYYVAARAADRVPNVYADSLYTARDDDPRAPRKPLMMGPFRIDVFEYPPPFLLLPRALRAAVPEFEGFRLMWFGLNAAVVLLAMVMMARMLGPGVGTRALLLSPLVWLAIPTLSMLQKGNVQGFVVALSLIAMALFEKRKWAIGGALLAYATVSKLYPGMLLVYLASQREWRALFWTAGFCAVLAALTLVDMGWPAYHAFLQHLPGLLGGEAFPAFRNPMAVAINLSLPGLVFKLKQLGVAGMGFPAAKLVGWIYTVVLLGVIVAAGRWRVPAERKPMVWLAILILATLRSPFLPQGYGVFPPLMLLALMGAAAAPNAKTLALVLFVWLGLNVYWPIDWAMNPRLLSLLILIPQVLTVGIAILALRWSRRLAPVISALAVLAFLAPVALAAPASPPASGNIADYAKGMTRQEGYLPLVWDGAKGRLLVEVPQPGEEFLYLVSSATGIGEPTINLDLDRGSVVSQYLAHFERVGPKLHLVARNMRFRATGGSEALARSVEESFPTSTLGSFEIVASSGDRVLADLTPLVLSDAVDVRASLREANQGNYSLDAGRSRVYLPHTKAFPKNSEVEAALTFTSDSPGSKLGGQAPDPRMLTLRQHHSFVKLPGPGYEPRAFDPRAGVFDVEYFDFSRPFDRDPVVRLITRHRLQKKDPAAAISEPVAPLVYYLDPAVPEPYRSAFREGVGWWNRVFEAAGFRNALRLEHMPEGMDPMDARYNVIQWLHRDDPGPSVGASLIDPRTGEIIKAAVRMDSYRSLVDYDLYAAMMPAMGKDAADPDPGAERFVMARRRQHAAHEVGHTLGFAHNFVGASEGRSSVMAYPAPLVRLTGGKLDLLDAYRAGPGAWDTLIVRYAYGDGDQADRERLLREAQERGLHFGTNPDEGQGGSYPATSVWVNGSDPVEELARMMTIRRFVLEGFDQRAIRPGEPMASLGRRFAEAYLFHGHTLDAAIKAIGGMEFDYAVRGDAAPPTRIVKAARQRRALELALDGLEPAELAVPERIATLLAPTPFGYSPDPQSFATRTRPAFDALAPARALAAETLGGILVPERCARLASFATRDPALPTLEEVIGRIVQRTFAPAAGARAATLRRVVQREVVDALLRLDANSEATPETRAGAEWGLTRVRQRVTYREGGQKLAPEEVAHRAALVRDIDGMLERRLPTLPPPAPPPQPRRPWPSMDWDD